MELFLMFALYGIFSALVYLAFCFIRRLFNFNLFIQIPLDLLCGFIIGMLFYHVTINCALGIVRFHLILGFILGLIITLITCKNFVATASDFVYNRIRMLIININEKISRRKTNGTKKTNPNS